MNVKAMLGRLLLCLSGVLSVSSVYAESVIIATPQQGVGITVDVFDHPEASSGTPSSTSTVPFRPQAFYIPSVQSFKGKVYMFWANNNDQKHINYATSAEGKNWSATQTISVDSIFSNVSVSVFNQKLVLTFTDPQGRLKTVSSENGTGWSTAKPISTLHTAINNKPIVYNGQLFVLYSENSGNAVYYVTSNDGVAWSRENLAFQESADKILTMVPVVYNGQLWAYYAFENGAMFARTYDRAGQWGAKQALTGINGQGPRGFLNSATMIGERVFISSSSSTFYSNDGLHWNAYFSKRFPGNSAYPSGLGVSYAITANDLTMNNPQLPADLATGLSHTDYATFAWRSFIALNNAANTPLPANRGIGNPSSSFADSGKLPQSPSPLLWQTFAHRTELFPPGGEKKGVGGPTRPFASSPQYRYVSFPNGVPLAPGASFAHYNNLDEATQIGQNAIFFPVNPPRPAMNGSHYAPSNDSQILFEAKANPVIYTYAQGLSMYPDHIVLPDGAVEVKAAWRKLADIPVAQRARYHTATVVTYHGTDKAPVAYNEDYALVALHIIHKTANYPTFIFATFEHEDAMTLPDKSPTGLYYIANYDKVAYSPDNGSPPVATFSDGNTTHTVTLPRGDVADSAHTPPIYSGSNGIPKGQAGPIRVVQPQTIYSEVTAVNNQVKQLMDGSSAFNNSVWKHYRLKGVQAIPSSTETDPDYYLANILVESSQPGIQLFRGSNVFPVPEDNTLTNMRTVKNIKVPDFDHSTGSQTMGGCMGCHGIAQSTLKQGFSFLFDAINRANFMDPSSPTGFANPETIGLPDTRTQHARALKYSFGFQNKGAVEETGK
ncbi:MULTISPECIES: sialidase family protein [unclassified Pseudomonas]|uniref:sialidase family protein n=1 Tax=unclassified Pseudomonas TaxID=196821 RepID=UPI00128AF135|nr:MULTISPECIES: sialidase family protein [unclassified Pseudomonas]MPQ71158.1 exo-alpha-sialidase [Pseudomonas sp. MWU12-2323]